MKILLYDQTDPDNPKLLAFDAFSNTAAPNDVDGANGDYYFRTHNGTESIYKKVGGTWVQVGGSVNPTIEREIVAGSAKSLFTIVQNFEAGTYLEVLQNGIEMTEFTGGGSPPANQWKRDAGANTIETGTAIPINGEFSIKVY